MYYFFPKSTTKQSAEVRLLEAFFKTALFKQQQHLPFAGTLRPKCCFVPDVHAVSEHC